MPVLRFKVEMHEVEINAGPLFRDRQTEEEELGILVVGYWSRIYIRTFVRINFSFTNIFGHSFVSNLFVRIYSDIRW